MAIKTKKPSRKQTVGAQYLCFASAEETGDYDGTYEADVEKTEVVKNVKITENSAVLLTLKPKTLKIPSRQLF